MASMLLEKGFKEATLTATTRVLLSAVPAPLKLGVWRWESRPLRLFCPAGSSSSSSRRRGPVEGIDEVIEVVLELREPVIGHDIHRILRPMSESIVIAFLMQGRQVRVIVPSKFAPHIVTHQLGRAQNVLLVPNVLRDLFGERIQ